MQTTGAFIQGEQLILNEKDDTKLSIQTVLQYTVDDIKSVFQDSDSLDSDLQSNFSADSVLYDRVLPGFSVADQLTVVGTAASVSNRNFAGKVGVGKLLLNNNMSPISGTKFNSSKVLRKNANSTV